jgi:hypothetical protein
MCKYRDLDLWDLRIIGLGFGFIGLGDYWIEI